MSRHVQKAPGILGLSLVTPEHVKVALQVVEAAGVMELWEQWRREDGYRDARPGRPKEVDEKTMLVLFILLAIEGSALHITRARDVIVYRATPEALAMLGLPQRDDWNFCWHDELRDRRWDNRLYAALRRLIAPLDLYPDNSYARRYTKEEFAQVEAARDPELIAQRRRRSQEFYGPILMESAKLLGTDFSRWTGDIVVDGTPIPASGTGTAARSTRVSSEPDAGWYRRGGDHNGDDANGREAIFWAFEASLIAMSGKDFGSSGLPAPIIGLSLDKPGHSISERALDALSHVTSDPSTPRGFFIGDRAYTPGAKAEKLQQPIRQAGYRIVGDLHEDQKGQVTAVYEGAQQVDGSWFCPALPDSLVGFTAGRDNKALLDDPEAQRMLEERDKYRLRIKEVTQDGSVKFMCPARGPGATVTCPIASGQMPDKPVLGMKRRGPRLRPKTATPPATGKKSSRLTLVPEQLPKGSACGKVCSNKSSLTIPLHVASKQAHQGPSWATKAWGEVYHRGRNIIESRNGLLKNASGVGIGDRTGRLIRGFSKQWFLVAAAAVAVNIRLVDAYLRRTGQELTPVPPPPTPPVRKTNRDAEAEPYWSNAPPAAA